MHSLQSMHSLQGRLQVQRRAAALPGGPPDVHRLRSALKAAERDEQGASDKPQPQQQAGDAPSTSASTSGGPRSIKLPKSGYFSLSDTKAEVYSRVGEKFDPTKRGGRYKSDFIWNVNWKETLDMEESLQRKAEQYQQARASGAISANTSFDIDGQPTNAGTVSFSRLAELNSMDVDLTAQLLRKNKKEEPPPQQPQQPRKRAAPQPPLRTDAKKLERVSRIVNQLALTVTSTKEDDQAERARIAELELKKYEEQKRAFLYVTLVVGIMGAAAVKTLYGVEAAGSYGVGAVAGLLYLRMLSRSVDAVGAQTLDGQAGSLASQPRLLIPIVLGLVFNRWNTLYAEDAGLTLQLLPMLVGFFTYKIGIITVEAKQLLTDLSYKSQDQQQQQKP